MSKRAIATFLSFAIAAAGLAAFVELVKDEARKIEPLLIAQALRIGVRTILNDNANCSINFAANAVEIPSPLQGEIQIPLANLSAYGSGQVPARTLLPTREKNLKLNGIRVENIVEQGAHNFSGDFVLDLEPMPYVIKNFKMQTSPDTSRVISCGLN